MRGCQQCINPDSSVIFCESNTNIQDGLMIQAGRKPLLLDAIQKLKRQLMNAVLPRTISP
jgi:hypothetical protein